MSVADVERKPPMTTATKTFRGRTLEEVLPQIKADLGPDAEIVRKREGLTGGVGGFFQRACVEIEARPPGEAEEPLRRFDAYDDEPAMPEPLPEPFAEFEPDPLPDPLPDADESMAEGLAAPGIQEIIQQAAPFANHLSHALEPEPAAKEPIEALLVDAGIASDRAHEIVAETVSHLVPFASRRQLRKLVRQGLARRIPVAPPPAAGGRPPAPGRPLARLRSPGGLWQAALPRAPRGRVRRRGRPAGRVRRAEPGGRRQRAARARGAARRGGDGRAHGRPGPRARRGRAGRGRGRGRHAERRLR